MTNGPRTGRAWIPVWQVTLEVVLTARCGNRELIFKGPLVSVGAADHDVHRCRIDDSRRQR